MTYRTWTVANVMPGSIYADHETSVTAAGVPGAFAEER